LQNLHLYFRPSESWCAWVDCDAVVVRDTPENFDGMKKEFGLTESEERELALEDTERQERRARRKKEGGVKPPLRGARSSSGYGDGCA
jgi:hypothetical protein